MLNAPAIADASKVITCFCMLDATQDFEDWFRCEHVYYRHLNQSLESCVSISIQEQLGAYCTSLQFQFPRKSLFASAHSEKPIYMFGAASEAA